VPATQIVAMLHVLVPLQLGNVPPFVEFPLRLFQVRSRGEWSRCSSSAFLSLVKLAHMAHVVTGVALWAFAVLVLVFASPGNAFDPVRLWSRIEPSRECGTSGFVGCHAADCCAGCPMRTPWPTVRAAAIAQLQTEQSVAYMGAADRRGILTSPRTCCRS
jgi:paraquat-inducible protein A